MMEDLKQVLCRLLVQDALPALALQAFMLKTQAQGPAQHTFVY